jgi:hypothetical protein
MTADRSAESYSSAYSPWATQRPALRQTTLGAQRAIITPSAAREPGPTPVAASRSLTPNEGAELRRTIPVEIAQQGRGLGGVFS